MTKTFQLLIVCLAVILSQKGPQATSSEGGNLTVFKKTTCHTTRFVVYMLAMIQSWANSRSRRFYEQGKASKFGGMDTDAAEDLLATLDAAESLKDISPLKSVGLHKLSGNRDGQWAMTVNGPWRICFRFKAGNAFDVEITNYHRG